MKGFKIAPLVQKLVLFCQTGKISANPRHYFFVLPNQPTVDNGGVNTRVSNLDRATTLILTITVATLSC